MGFRRGVGKAAPFFFFFVWRGGEGSLGGDVAGVFQADGAVLWAEEWGWAAVDDGLEAACVRGLLHRRRAGQFVVGGSGAGGYHPVGDLCRRL